LAKWRSLGRNRSRSARSKKAAEGRVVEPLVELAELGATTMTAFRSATTGGSSSSSPSTRMTVSHPRSGSGVTEASGVVRERVVTTRIIEETVSKDQVAMTMVKTCSDEEMQGAEVSVRQEAPV